MTDNQKRELKYYEILKKVFDQVDKTKIHNNFDRFELNLATTPDTDTEIFMRTPFKIWSFQVSFMPDGSYFFGSYFFYDRWNLASGNFNESTLLEFINKTLNEGR